MCGVISCAIATQTHTQGWRPSTHHSTSFLLPTTSNPCFLPLAPSARSKKQKQQPPNATTGDITDSPTAAAAHSPGCTLPLREMASSTVRFVVGCYI